MIGLYKVEFPGLNIHLKLSPIAFYLGSYPIYWYGIIISLGILICFLYIFLNSKRFNLNADKVLDCAIIGIVIGIIGARLYYVIFYPGDIYLKNPLLIFNVHEGGIAIYGALIFGTIAGIVTAKVKKIEILPLLDIAGLCFLIGQSIGRWGNFFNQEAFGSGTNLPWGMSSQNTFYKTVHPCFLYESLWCILGFLLLHIFSKKYKKYDGQVFLMYLIWYGFGRFFIEGLRSDSLFIPGTFLKVSQVLSILIVTTSIIILLVIKKKRIFNRN